MFVFDQINYSKMNYTAKYSALSTSPMMGCSTSMSCMPMIMRQPSSGVIIHIA